jgi:hypothetical protein
MPSIYVFDQTAAGQSSYIECIGTDGAKYRIKFDRLEGGLEINKTCDTGASESLAVYPNCVNQIRVK